MTDTVLVTGGSGYIAGYLIRQLASEGWMVHTTIRNLSKESGVRKLLAVDNDRLKCYQADLTEDEGWASAMAGCTHVAHLASPFPARAVKSPDDLIVPARDGALRALRAAKAAGVRRFVMTSSIAAIGYGRPRGTYTLTEADWSIVDGTDISAYAMSKTIAERAARDWVATEGGSVEFCTINPSLVLGPVWSGDFSTSVEAIKKLLDGALPGCPDLHFGLVDVRDLADLHVRALKAPDMAGERFIASGRTFSMVEIAKTLKERLGAEARRVPTRKLPDILVRISALFDPAVKSLVPELGTVRNWDASHARKVLGWSSRPPEESIVDTARSLIDLGLVKR